MLTQNIFLNEKEKRETKWQKEGKGEEEIEQVNMCNATKIGNIRSSFPQYLSAYPTGQTE